VKEQLGFDYICLLLATVG